MRKARAMQELQPQAQQKQPLQLHAAPRSRTLRCAPPCGAACAPESAIAIETVSASAIVGASSPASDHHSAMSGAARGCGGADGHGRDCGFGCDCCVGAKKTTRVASAPVTGCVIGGARSDRLRAALGIGNAIACGSARNAASARRGESANASESGIGDAHHVHRCVHCFESHRDHSDGRDRHSAARGLLLRRCAPPRLRSTRRRSKLPARMPCVPRPQREEPRLSLKLQLQTRRQAHAREKPTNAPSCCFGCESDCCGSGCGCGYVPRASRASPLFSRVSSPLSSPAWPLASPRSS